MLVFAMGKNFTRHESTFDNTLIEDWVGVPKRWFYCPLPESLIPPDQLSVFRQLDIYGDGQGTIPHLYYTAICHLKKSCLAILSLSITPKDLIALNFDTDYIETFDTYIASLQALVTLCDKAIARHTILAFLPE